MLKDRSIMILKLVLIVIIKLLLYLRYNDDKKLVVHAKLIKIQNKTGN